MYKTEQQIERDFYQMVKESVLGKAIQGNVYRSEMRPNNAKTEDIVVKFISGLNYQVQTGIVVFNVYVPDIVFSQSGKKVINHKRVAELQELINDFVSEYEVKTEYLIEYETTPTTLYNEDIEQHFIYTRLNFKRLRD